MQRFTIHLSAVMSRRSLARRRDVAAATEGRTFRRAAEAVSILGFDPLSATAHFCATGRISKVITIKSTGFGGLEYLAIEALSKWRLKPGTWKELDVPVTFYQESKFGHRPRYGGRSDTV
jgi:hypothetical protein